MKPNEIDLALDSILGIQSMVSPIGTIFGMPYTYQKKIEEVDNCPIEITHILAGPYRYCIDLVLTNSEHYEIKLWCDKTFSSGNKIKDFFGIKRYCITHNSYALYYTKSIVHIMFRSYDDAVMFKMAWDR